MEVEQRPGSGGSFLGRVLSKKGKGARQRSRTYNAKESSDWKKYGNESDTLLPSQGIGIPRDFAKGGLDKFENSIETYAFFRRTDRNPRKQRKSLFALSLFDYDIDRIANISSATSMAKSKNYENFDIRDGPGQKKVSVLSGLNTLLKHKMVKATRSGVFHRLAISIHDRRENEALKQIDLLTPNSLTKKRPADSNRAFLHAAVNNMQSVCIAMMEKGFPEDLNSPVFAAERSSSKKSLIFPSYFHIAVALKLPTLVKTMLKSNVNFQKQWFQMAPITLAVLQGNEIILKSLLDANANLSVSINADLFLTLKKIKLNYRKLCIEHFPEAELCLQHFKDRDDSVFRRDIMNNQPDLFMFCKGKKLHLFEMAAMKGHYSVAYYLLSQTSLEDTSTVYFALLISNNHVWSKQLLDAGIPIDSVDQYGCNALHIAARRGYLDMVIVLLKKNFDINGKGSEGWTALHEAISASSMNVAHYLIYKKIDLSIKSDSGLTARDLARRRGFDEATISQYFDSHINIQVFQEKEMAARKIGPVKCPLWLSGPESVGRPKDGVSSKFGSFFRTSSSSSSADTGSKPRQFFRRTSISK